MRTFESGHDGHQRRRRAKGFTLIEVLASVVIIVMAGTAALFAVESVQAGQLKEAEYSKALGLATTIAEELKDRNPNAYTNDLQVIQQELKFIFQALQTANLSQFIQFINNMFSGDWTDLELQLLNNPSMMSSLQNSLYPTQDSSANSPLDPFIIKIPGDALSQPQSSGPDYVLYVPSPQALQDSNNSQFTQFMLWLARGGANWNDPYQLMNGYTCTVSVSSGTQSSSQSSITVTDYTIVVQSRDGVRASVTVPIVSTSSSS